MTAVVRAVDVLPTALDLLAVDGSGRSVGTSLAPLLTGAERSLRLPAYSEAVYPRYHYGWSDLRALRVGDLKYIAAPRPELYNLAADPNEARNLYAEKSSRRRTSTCERPCSSLPRWPPLRTRGV